jgi:hypothetical protein
MAYDAVRVAKDLAAKNLRLAVMGGGRSSSLAP